MKEKQTRNFFSDLRAATVRYRSENSLSQGDLAKTLGIDGSTLSRFENGHSLLNESTLSQLIQMLGSPSSIAARQLRVLADILDSTDLEESAKQDRLATTLQSILDYADIKRVAENGAHYGE